MHRSMFAALLVLSLAGCVSNGGSFESQQAEVLPPDFTFGFVVDGKVVRTVSFSSRMDEISVVVQPRSGESAIWQNHGATYAHVVVYPRQGSATPSGGSDMEISGEIEYYRDMKFTQGNGNDEVVRGKPIDSEEVEDKRVTVEPGAPALVDLAEGISVVITALPKAAPAPAPRP